MKNKPLGRTGILVSELCLGTMTFGTQTNEIDAHKQLDLALESGINFIDTAEMYPVNPISKEQLAKLNVYRHWMSDSSRVLTIFLQQNIREKA